MRLVVRKLAEGLGSHLTRLGRDLYEIPLIRYFWIIPPEPQEKKSDGIFFYLFFYLFFLAYLIPLLAGSYGLRELPFVVLRFYFCTLLLRHPTPTSIVGLMVYAYIAGAILC